MNTPLSLVLAALGGLVVGSFLNVVIARVPAGESVVGGRSRCPSCATPVRAFDLVPLLSWVILKRRCRACQAPISWRYPAVEAATAVLAVAIVAAHRDDTAALVLGLALVLFLVPIAMIDFDVRRIPNVLTGTAAVTALVLGLVVDLDGQPERILAGVAAALFLGIPALIAPHGMGMGDAKLTGVMGLYLGAAVAPAIGLGLVVGALGGVVIMAVKGVAAGRKTTIPFGPFLALGAGVMVFLGDATLDWYRSVL